jgi:DNA replication and repair protein RecF
VWVSELSLRDFRNHRETDISLEPGVTTFIGPNGQGKTNLVEALGYLSHLISHRVSSDKALVREGMPTATIRGTVRHGERHVSLALAINVKGANRAKLGGQSVSVGELMGWLRVVLFTPEDLMIVRGEPGMRRKYLDEAVLTLSPKLHPVYSEYDRVIRQRNALLKSARGQSAQSISQNLESWNEALVPLAAQITYNRHRVIIEVLPYLASSYTTIAPGHEIAWGLDTPVDSSLSHDDLEAAYRSQLSERAREEFDRGMTLVGPHRDDLIVTLNGLPSRTHSSHGEAWSIALSLRLAIAQAYRVDSSSGDPVMILDDVFAELDSSRRATLRDVVSDYEQVLVTAAVNDDVPQGFSAHSFMVRAGEVTPYGS